jgi:hypothetical protein
MKRRNSAEILQSCGDQNAPSNQQLAPAPVTAPGNYAIPLPYVIARKTRGPRQARRGWLRRDDVLNARPLAQVKKLLAGTRH